MDFVRSRPDLELPDLELMFLPAPYVDEAIGDPYPRHAVTFGPILLRPHSRGTITPRSRDPKDKPIIHPQYRSDGAGTDRTAIMAGLRICAKIAEAPALPNVIGNIARPLQATRLDDRTLEWRFMPTRTPPITKSAPAGWAATTPAWSIRSCAYAVSKGCAWRTRR